MGTEHKVDRAEFLRLSAVAAVSAAVAACQPAQPTTQPGAQATAPGGQAGTAIPGATLRGKYKEAPMLAEQVKAGKLPPVDQRLPENPYVVPHRWLSVGKYGGQMQWACSNDWGTAHYIQESMYGHSPLRWLRDGLEIRPGLAEKWEAN